METNYFTPIIEELHVGYQCEITYAKDLIGTRDEYFFKYIVEPQYFNEGDYVAIRTPFLTRENIEKEFDVEVEKRFWYGKYWDVFNDSSKHNYTVKYRFENQHMEINKDDESDIVFDGYVRCVNELRTILKLLKI